MLYDTVSVDIESLKNYIKKLVKGEVFIESFKQESDADNAEYILRIAQLNNGLLPQLKYESEFGRNYYKGLSVQNVSKRVREAFLGDSWEYDCKSCSASWKMAFAREWYDSKKRHRKSFDDSVCGLTLYLLPRIQGRSHQGSNDGDWIWCEVNDGFLEGYGWRSQVIIVASSV
jgi:hypothetical protein